VLVPARRLGRGSVRVRPATGQPVRVPRPAAFALTAVGLAALVAVPWLVGARLPVFTSGVTFVMVFVSLALLLYLSGQISLCHAAFAAVGATTFSHLTHGLGLPWVAALLLTGAAAAARPATDDPARRTLLRGHSGTLAQAALLSPEATRSRRPKLRRADCRGRRSRRTCRASAVRFQPSVATA